MFLKIPTTTIVVIQFLKLL